MSPRITRSSTRQAASQQAAQASGTHTTHTTPRAAPPSSAPGQTLKRKASNDKSSPPAQQPAPSARRSKRPKIPEAPPTLTPSAANPSIVVKPQRKGKAPVEMEGSENALPGHADTPGNSTQPAASSRKSSRSKKQTSSAAQDAAAAVPSASRRPRRSTNGTRDQDVTMGGTDDQNDSAQTRPPPSTEAPDEDGTDDHGHDETRDVDRNRFDEHDDEEEEDDDDDDDDDEDDEDDDDDPFGAFGGPGSGLSSTLRALTGMMSGLSGRLRELLSNLRQDDLSIQAIALQELSEILLVSNEDNLSGHFSPDAFVKELVLLMNKEESPEVMLLACRCLANLMEALPASVANVVYGNAVPVLCQKLLEISFIDLAEQALSTLEKISAEYPSSIVREGGLTACLSYLDFFATSTQRTAVTTAAHCCRNIPDDSFPVVREVMPILLNVLGSSDQRVVEQASLCVSGIVESFKNQPAKLEELVSADLLRAVLRLLVPGTTNLIGSSIHTQFLRVLAFTARASPQLSAELFKMNVVETLYQILTGVSPPSGTEDVAAKLDSVIVMQALIHRPRDQIVETLNVICELLPSLPRNANPSFGDFVELLASTESATASSSGPQARPHPNDKRVELLEDCKEEVRRFALILFPTLTDAFSSTVNLSVRQKVLTAQLKMLSNLDEDILTEALTHVPYASLLASILSQRDHPSLVMLGLQATELLLCRLDSIYRYQLYREGVVYEINKLATEEEPMVADRDAANENDESKANGDASDRELDDEDDASAENEDDEEEDGDDDEENGDDEHEPIADDMFLARSRGSTMSFDAPPQQSASDLRSMQSRIRHVAKKFLETHEGEGHGQAMKAKANVILSTLSDLAAQLDAFYLKRTAASLSSQAAKQLFAKLASHFDTHLLESVTSAELLASGLVRTLLNVFSNPDGELARAAQSTFLEVFMGHAVRSRPKTATAESPATPFSVMIHKLQDLLSRSEHFEVLTVHHNSFDGNRSSPASMLGKQIRLRLVADDDSDIPRPFRNIMVSIHAIATFKSLDDYLRPRISAAENPHGSRRDGLARAFAALSGAGAMPLTGAAAARLRDMTAYSSGLMQSPPPPPPPPPSMPSSSRFSRRSKGRAFPLSHASAGPSQKETPRRSSRRQAASADTPTPHRPPPTDEEELQNTLECADEKQLTDEEDDGVDGSTLDAIVRDLDEDMDEEIENAPEPSAVNVEVATGGKVIARKDDGTRVLTPAAASNLPTRGGRPSTATSGQGTPTPSMPAATTAMSYASALQAVPQDWHIEYTLDDRVIPSETTIYRAVHTSTPSSDDLSSRSIWSATHPIRFRRVPGPPPTAPQSFGPNPEAEGEIENGIPASLAKNPTTSTILRLLNILHELNANIEDVLAENRNSIISLNVEPPSQFVNTKLTAKLNRQLEEPLIVASCCLPGWSEDLARLYPFLFPFETRHLFLQSTSFGYARSMARWQSAQSTEDNRRDRNNERPFLGRLQRQKVRISRLKMLESALKVMDLYGASQSVLEVEYFEEVGTGLGPTLEFYATVSKEFSKKKLKLWREVDSLGNDEFVSGQSGLFPRPLSQEALATANGERILQMFKMLGKFVARSMIDSRIIDIHFNPIFFRIGDTPSTGVKPSLGAVKMVDPGLARSLKVIKKFALAKKEIDEDANRTAVQKVADTADLVVDNVRLEDLCLDFTLPGYPNIELEVNGSHKRLTMENVDLYLERVIDLTLGSGVRQQVDAFRAGFSTVFPYSALSAFTPDELVTLFGRVDEDWSLETLTDSIKADHGYNMDSQSVKNLLQTMAEFDVQQRREFLQFTTGSPKLPIGGFRSLTPMFTVVCKPSEHPYMSDDYLPSVMTCVNYLKLPDYSTVSSMKKQLFTAMKEGQGAFHLS
ncbi:HECT-domain-containing protein [Drechmeria coniospora]|uniref:HECT-type E3 ubiquitin transferase n=1 Tax=Drechmeria coniospora TaxID=98403 RepID=A0A151GU59_DRECN|nr:HECT-domain-containing protein [Drechmeria coniospora]KYK60645.1 HECT-domain-containing protein [Drechmeria coniospora]